MWIDLTPGEEARLAAAARRIGVSPAEFVRRLALEHLPDEPALTETAVDAKLGQWQQQDGTSLAPDIPARAMFAAWAEEDAKMTDAERDAEDRLWEDFQKGINETRTELGLRQL
jgi:hypothetical protein